MYAIVMTGGKQYKVEKGMNVVIEKIDEAEVGKEVVLDQVLKNMMKFQKVILKKILKIVLK